MKSQKRKSILESRKRHKVSDEYKSPANESKNRNETKRKKSNSMQRINEIVRSSTNTGMTYGEYQAKGK